MQLQDFISAQITDTIIDKISSSIGIDTNQTSSIATKAIPLLLGGMMNNIRKNNQVDNLYDAIKNDHDGSVFDHIDDMIADSSHAKGDKILKHVLGNAEDTVENSVAGISGVQNTHVKSIFQMMAPLVMGLLGKYQTDKNLSKDDILSLITELNNGTYSQSKDMTSLLKLLDQDGDGHVTDDLLAMGISTIKKQ